MNRTYPIHKKQQFLPVPVTSPGYSVVPPYAWDDNLAVCLCERVWVLRALHSRYSHQLEDYESSRVLFSVNFYRWWRICFFVAKYCSISVFLFVWMRVSFRRGSCVWNIYCLDKVFFFIVFYQLFTKAFLMSFLFWQSNRVTAWHTNSSNRL